MVRMDGVAQVILKLKFKHLRFIDYPLHRAMAQSCRWISSADIRIHSRKPNLFDVDLGLWGPQGGGKVLPVFIYRHGMPGMLDDLARFGVVEKEIAITKRDQEG